VKDSWESGDPYEYYMGRWSLLVAESFVDWLQPSSGLKWLDVGCGSGALSEAIINKCKPARLTAIDQSKDFVRTAQRRLGNRVYCGVGDALSLPLEKSSVNIAVSGLVLNFISEPEKALSEMRRVTAAGGAVAVYLWDYTGKMEFLKHFWDAAVEIKPEAWHLHESKRFPSSNAEALKRLFEKVGFVDIETTSIEITTRFQDFDDYWKPFLGGQGPAPSLVLSLSDDKKNKLRNSLKARMPTQLNGSISLAARAWAAKGQVPQ
jgi:ubiquinone/menaquinone biosynthesis C-methylase UbiE